MIYDDKTANLTLTFRSGRTYNYTVPPAIAQGLARAESPGGFFNDHIKG
jgi:hypothetical protein